MISRSASANIRFLLIPCGLAVWFALMLARLVQLHFWGPDIKNKIGYREELPASRGAIYDRGGNPIAVSEPGWRIYLDPLAPNRKATKKRPAADPVATCRRVADLTGRDFREVYVDLYTTNRIVFNPVSNQYVRVPRRYIVQGETFDKSAIDLVTNKTLYVKNVNLEPTQRRSYPQGRRFAHVLGFITGRDLIGQNGGIEQRYDRELRGTDGYVSGVRSCNGPEIRERRTATVNPIDGASIYLTIDQNIQMVVHEALSAAVEKWGAEGGRAIVEKVDTGEILAMVSLPDFDPADWHDSAASAWKNRAITDIYDPGSTMKSVTVSAALNENIVTPETTYDVGQGYWVYGGSTLRDHPKGVINVETILAKSSNIGAAKIALDLGNKRFERYLRAFGFGARCDIDLPGEATGILTPCEKWSMISPTRIAIGQGISVTPLQMVNAYSTIANGGKRMRPYVMQRIVAPNGDVIHRNEPLVLARPIRPEVASKMRRMLTKVVSPQGTARRARVPGYVAAGKTGTAQIVKPTGGYYDHNHWASFVGFLPADNPVFAVIVVLDNPINQENPRLSHDGGVSAAPVFAEIAAATAQYLELPVEVEEGTVAGNP